MISTGIRTSDAATNSTLETRFKSSRLHSSRAKHKTMMLSPSNLIGLTTRIVAIPFESKYRNRITNLSGSRIAVRIS
jgi:hypothetical protein